MPQLTLTNRSELYPDVLNSVNRNASNEISQTVSHAVVRIFCPVVYYLVLGAFKERDVKIKGTAANYVGIALQDSTVLPKLTTKYSFREKS